MCRMSRDELPASGEMGSPTLRRAGAIRDARLPRVRQIAADHEFMRIALTVRERADCLLEREGAVLVLDGRVCSTGSTGTPAGFGVCSEGGCGECADRLMDAPPSTSACVARCLCSHAEARALTSAAKLGQQVSGATLYATASPCFSCLLGAVEAGVDRVVYLREGAREGAREPAAHYDALVRRLRRWDVRSFERIAHPEQLFDAPLVVAARHPLHALHDAEPIV